MSIKTHVDLSDENVTWDLSADVSYGGYLRLDTLLSAQQPRSDAHDEGLFIIAHQVSELWLKLILHEVGAAMEQVNQDALGPAFKMLSRVSKIQTQLENLWEVLTTMTPADYLSFRDKLGHASGFQSYQYRMVEYALGNKNAKLTDVFKHDPKVHERVCASLNAPSLYDATLMLMARRGFDLPPHVTERDWSLPYEPCDEVEAAWRKVYEDSSGMWDLYELAETLLDVEEGFHRWRFRHLKTVERIIGHRKGTGGTGGVSYLVKALELRFFPELWTVRTGLTG